MEVKIDDSVIFFPNPKYHFGQKVFVDNKPGYIVGLQREKYSWMYLVVDGDPPPNNSAERWVQEHKLSTEKGAPY